MRTDGSPLAGDMNGQYDLHYEVWAREVTVSLQASVTLLECAKGVGSLRGEELDPPKACGFGCQLPQLYV